MPLILFRMVGVVLLAALAVRSQEARAEVPSAVTRFLRESKAEFDDARIAYAKAEGVKVLNPGTWLAGSCEALGEPATWSFLSSSA